MLYYLQRAGGAVVRAKMAVFTGGDDSRVVEFGLDDGVEASADETEDALLRLILAHSHAQTAQDTLALVALDGDEPRFPEAGVMLALEPFAVDTVGVRVLD